jgi:uncharacterized membrane protein
MATGLAAVVALVVPPLVGWPGVVRLPAILFPAFVIAVLVVRPWRLRGPDAHAWQTWEPSTRVVWFSALIVGAVLFWCVLTRFRSGEINAVDFTVYFDRPAFQTLHGRPMFVETSDVPAFSQASAFGIHAYWAMLPLSLLYALAATPLWLLALSVVAVVAGAAHVLRIMRRLGAGGVLASATALAFALNDNTARTLNYGFHPEVLYAWFIPWLIDAGLRGDRKSFLAAALACVMVKEDACMPLFAASVALALNRFDKMTWADRAVFLLAPSAIALGNLGVYYRYVMPALNAGGGPTYAAYWANYGATPLLALLGMLTHPGRVLAGALTSGFRRVIVPHLFLPVIGWRWALGIVPIVALYGASANENVRAFGVYYPIVLVPFLVLGASTGALTGARRVTADIGRARIAASVAILLGALVAGSTNASYSLRPWRSETGAVSDALARLAGERAVLVQSGLYPHAGYDQRIQLLTPAALRHPGNAGIAVLLAPKLSAYPFRSADLDALHGLPPIRQMPEGLVAVRIPGTPGR